MIKIESNIITNETASTTVVCGYFNNYLFLLLLMRFINYIYA